MFSPELKQLLIQVICSREVIGVTAALVIYLILVNYAASSRHRKRRIALPGLPRKRTKAPAKAAARAKEDEDLDLDDEDEIPARKSRRK
ncbi:MAG: hypothetical protein LBR16_06265 [Treponema sp.]|jgi:hypothetical protein|nr:hypothetical protein [Treponema sp.]